MAFNLRWPTTVTAISIWPRQYQFGHGNFNLAASISIWPLQFQFGHGKINLAQTLSQGHLSTLRKYPGFDWSRVCACQRKPHRGWVLNLILSTFSREVNVGLLYGRYFEKEASYLSEILPGQLLRLYLNFYDYDMLIETELCSYFTSFLNNRQQITVCFGLV